MTGANSEGYPSHIEDHCQFTTLPAHGECLTCLCHIIIVLNNKYSCINKNNNNEEI